MVSLVVSLSLVDVFLVNALHDFYGDSSVGVSTSVVQGRHQAQAVGEDVAVVVGRGTAVALGSFYAMADHHCRVGCGGEVS